MTNPAQRERQFDRDAVVRIVAVQLDMPSLYMSGPSMGSRRNAEKIVSLLETNGILTFDAAGETP